MMEEGSWMKKRIQNRGEQGEGDGLFEGRLSGPVGVDEIEIE
jgi:hypothetical protein